MSRGLPGVLPEGEAVLWQGAPDARVLARTALHTRKLALYFGLLACWGAGSAALAGEGAAAASVSLLKFAVVGAAPIVLALLYAWAVSRGTVYTITNRRVVLHIGLGLPVTLNLPFTRVAAADVKFNAKGGADGSGDLSLTLSGRDRFSYVVLWPHARPWRFARPEPTLRGLAHVQVAAQVLSRALAASAGMAAPVLASNTPSRAAPQHATLAA